MRRSLAAVALVVLALACARRPVSDARPFDDVRDLEGHVVDPFAHRAPATILVFVGVECPLSNRSAPDIRRIATDAHAHGAALFVVYPSSRAPLDAIVAHARDRFAGLSIVRDPKHRLVERAGAHVTPEAVVFDADGSIAYRGRIDDRQVDFGVAQPEATRRDLAIAIDEVLAGKKPSVTETKAIGCSID